MIKGCNFVVRQKSANTCSFVGGRIMVQKEKISRAERSWTNPLNALQEAMHYSFVKFCIYCFTLCYEFFMHYALKVEKFINIISMRDLWNFRFFGRGDVSPTHSELSLHFGVIGITRGLISCNKESGTKRACNFLYPKSSFEIRRTAVLGILKDSATLLDAIRLSFLTKSSTVATFTSVRVVFGWPPLSSSSTSPLPSRN